MLRILAIPMLFLSLGLTACQTSMVRQFDKVTIGMEKDDVLDIMGSPTRTQRFHDKDRWTYIYYDKRIRHEKEIQFFEGNSVYVGEIFQPAPEDAAIAVDARNEQLNKAVDAEIAREIVKHRNDYLNYESSVRGEDKVRYIPQFQPIQ